MSLARIPRLFHELRSRRVFRAAGLYTVAAWAVVEVANTAFPILELPGWTVKLVLALALLGFPVALALAWAFDLGDTPVVPSSGTLNETGTGDGAEPPADSPETARGRVLRVPLARAAAVALVAALAGAGGWASWRRAAASHPAASSNAVAVLPFEVRAGADAEYLREGMVSLLAARLDGAGGLHSADPQALLRSVAAGKPLDAGAARQLASRVGAGLYVQGSVVGGSGRIQLSASLYESGMRRGPVATASAEGPADSVFSLVDQVAMQLLAARAGPADGAVRTAARTTGSLPAFQAYLEGERAFRELRVSEAVEAFGRAAAADSTFALAYSRLAFASMWHGDDTLATTAIEAAERHSARLSPRLRALIAADAAFARGDPDIESRYQRVAESHPQDAAAWYRLAEVIYHQNPARGRSRLEAREPFERALALDPGNEMYLVHLREIACIDGRAGDLASLRPTGVHFDSLNALANGTVAALAGPPSRRDRVLRGLAEASDLEIAQAANVAVSCAPPEALPALFALADRHEPRPGEWMEDKRLELRLDLGRGRWEAGRAVLSRFHVSDPSLEASVGAIAAFQPLMSPGKDDLQRARRNLLAFDPSRPTVVTSSPAHREYLLGRIALLLHDDREAMEHLAVLERLGAAHPDSGEIAVDARSLRAHALAAAGRREEALRVLEELDTLRLEGEMGPRSQGRSNADSRWLRAELLRELGRDGEALPWYVTLAEEIGTPTYQAAGHLRIAQVHDRLGERREAVHSYRRFLALWRDADPRFQPLVREAERRVAALER